MALYWTEERKNAGLREAPANGDWRDGVYIPSGQAANRKTRTTLIHDFVRTLLELRGE